MIPDSQQISLKKIGRPKGSKDKKKRRQGSGLHNSNRNKAIANRAKGIEGGPGTGTKHKKHPSRPFYTSLYFQDENLNYLCTSHRKKMLERDCPLGVFTEERENPFKVEFK